MAETQYHRSALVSILNSLISTQLNAPDTVVMIAASALPPCDTVLVIPLVAVIPATPNTVTGPLPPHDTVAVMETVPRVVILVPTTPNTVTSPLPPHDTAVVMGTVPRVVIPIPTTPLNTVTNPLPPHDTVAVMMEAVAVIRLPGVVITSALPGDDTNPMLVANVGKSRYS